MKKYFFIIAFLSLVGISIWLLRSTADPQQKPFALTPALSQEDVPRVTAIAEHFDTPWALAFLPDKSILVTERSGEIHIIDNQGNLASKPLFVIPSVEEIGEGGLLGIALHPDFTTNNFVYLYYTYKSSGENTLNRVVRMTYKNATLADERIIVDAIPGASNHNGGRIQFGPDGFLYIGTGDAQEPSRAQDKKSLAGKILRVTDEGKVPSGNPFRNQVYSWGHRNVQGLAWDDQGNLWATEHGRSGVASGYDELNKIISGGNYGWPEIQGDETRSGMHAPQRHSGGMHTWAPSGAVFVDNSIFFSGLRGKALYEAVIEDERVIEVKTHFENEYGRIREVVKGPDGMLYLTTSNRDGRGMPSEADDRIIRVNPKKL